MQPRPGESPTTAVHATRRTAVVVEARWLSDEVPVDVAIIDLSLDVAY